MARTLQYPARTYWKAPSTNPTEDGYRTSASTCSDVKAFDIERDMVRSLVAIDPDARPRHFRNAFEECVFVFTIMMATASTTFLQGAIIINTANIGTDLMMSPAQIVWITAAIGLASGSFMLFFGKTADLFGCKFQLLCGMGFLSLFALFTSFASTPTVMNIFCGFLGLGTAVVSPPSIGALFAAYPEGQRRNKATGALGVGNPVGFILGSMSSGVVTRFYTWRASFVVISIFFFIMTILSFWTVPSIPRSDSPQIMLRHFDYLGTALTIVGMAFVSAALTEAPELGWKAPQVIAMMVLGAACLCGFGFWEHFYKYPLLNPVVWKNTNFTLCVLCTLFGYMSFITNQFWISLYMQDVQHLAPLHIAARLLPQAITGIIWSYLGQALVSIISGKVIMGIGALAYLAGATLLIFIRQDTSYWMLLFPALCITVIGADFQFIVSNLYITKQMPSQSSLAAGVLQTAMRLSVSLGLSITTAVYVTVGYSTKGKANTTFPFERAYLCSILFAVIGLLFVPFMQIGKQGKKPPPPSNSGSAIMEGRPRAAAEYTDRPINEHTRVIRHKPS